MTHYINVPLSEATYQRIKRLAATQQRDVGEAIADYITEMVATTDDPITPQDALADEIATFEALKPGLLQTHPDEFVAIYQKEIVGFDQDEMNLVRRVYEKFGPVPCYIEKIVPDTPRKVRMPSRWKPRQ
jgi:hypothetical protein